ncbi:MAG: hypothetical protein IPN84_17745 [Sphingomonadales bacterium]|nr:hypothetical protein [Sphingomonadales bacterium]
MATITSLSVDDFAGWQLPANDVVVGAGMVVGFADIDRSELVIETVEPDESFAGRDLVRKMLLVLTPREERVVRMRYGIGCREHGIDELGELFGISRARVAQIELKAMRKLNRQAVRARLTRNRCFGR